MRSSSASCPDQSIVPFYVRATLVWLSLFLACSSLGAQSLITGVTATASDVTFSPASDTVNWSGMSGVQGDETATQNNNDQDMWGPLGTTENIQWDFGSPRQVSRMLLWQYNFGNRAIKTATLEHSVDGTNWTDFSNKAPATWPTATNEPGDNTVVDVSNLSFTARYVKLTCLTGYGPICGVSEVLFWQDNSLRPILTAATPTHSFPIPVSVTFRKDGAPVSVTGFEVNDLNVTNALVSDFNGSGHTYDFFLLPSTDPANVTVSIPAAAAIGDGNASTSNASTIDFTVSGGAAGTPTIIGPSIIGGNPGTPLSVSYLSTVTHAAFPADWSLTGTPPGGFDFNATTGIFSGTLSGSPDANGTLTTLTLTACAASA